MNNRMIWTEYHEKKVLKLYKKVKEEWEKDEKFTCSMTSLLRKFENNLYLDTKGKEGLSSVSKLNKKIFNEDFDVVMDKDSPNK